MNKTDRFNLSDPKNMALIAIAVGVLFLIFPNGLLTTLIYVLGLVGICFGAYHIYAYFAKKDAVSEVKSRLAIGLMFAALGLYFVLNPGYIIDISNFLFGLVILAFAFFLVQYALDLKDAGFKLWLYILAAAVVCVVMATLVLTDVFRAQASRIAFTGVALLVAGASQLLSDVLLNRTGFDRSKVKQNEVKVDASLFTSTLDGVKNTITEVVEKVNEKQEEVAAAAKEKKSEAVEVVSEHKEKAADLAGEVKEWFAEAAEEAKDAAAEVKENLEDAAEEVKEDLAAAVEEVKENL